MSDKAPGSEVSEFDPVRYQKAIQFYQGDFLEGFHVREAIAFEEWATIQREHFRERMLATLWMLVSYYQSRADHTEGLQVCTHLLELDAWNEETHRLKMKLLAVSGQRSAALAHYESCCKILLEEFGVAPTSETQAIYEQIRPNQNNQRGVRFRLQNVVTEYLTNRLVEAMGQELETGAVALLNRHVLLKAQPFEYVKESQKRLILQPIAQRLVDKLGTTGAIERLRRVLAENRSQLTQTPGYAAANLLHLMTALDVDLRGADFSHLAVWQADLRVVDLPAVNFAHANLADSLFRDMMGIVSTVAFSPDGLSFSALTFTGEIRLWRTADSHTIRLWHIDQLGVGTLHHVLSGHSSIVNVVAFSPDGQLLASGSGMGFNIRIWDVVTGRCHYLLHGHSSGVEALAFHPKTGYLASGEHFGEVRLWDIARGELVSVVHAQDSSFCNLALSAYPKSSVTLYSRSRNRSNSQPLFG
ncbi:hypothetical protein KFU94_12730 [Chloroflexi bacterium TSY]|nr:hypothetical protein [Chloroflexi bacterium TSY]